MSNRAFHAVVILLWLSTMGWLVVEKVLPPLLVGDPPTYRSAIPKVDEIVCWRLEWNDQPMGWSASRTNEEVEGVKELDSRVMLRERLHCAVSTIIRVPSKFGKSPNAGTAPAMSRLRMFNGRSHPGVSISG